jgi:plastocyanin
MSGRFVRIAGGLAALALLVGAAGAARADVIVVSTRSNFFSPSDITITTGDTISWSFDQGTHTTTSADGLWDSGILSQGASFQHTFTQAGNYAYICRLHIACCNMSGVIHVVDPVDLSGSLASQDADDPNATGRAAFEMRANRSTLSVAVTNVVSTTSVDVFVNGNFVGTITLDSNGNGELDLNTANGDMVPNLHDGDEIEVYDAADDVTLILLGNVSVGG